MDKFGVETSGVRTWNFFLSERSMVRTEMLQDAKEGEVWGRIGMKRWGVFLQRALCVCVCVLVAQICPTLWNPIDCSLPGSSVHEILQARILDWIVIPSSRWSSQPRDWTWASCIAGRSITVWAPGKPQKGHALSFSAKSSVFTVTGALGLSRSWVVICKLASPCLSHMHWGQQSWEPFSPLSYYCQAETSASLPSIPSVCAQHEWCCPLSENVLESPLWLSWYSRTSRNQKNTFFWTVGKVGIEKTKGPAPVLVGVRVRKWVVMDGTHPQNQQTQVTWVGRNSLHKIFLQNIWPGSAFYIYIYFICILCCY